MAVKQTLAPSRVKKSLEQELKEKGYRLPHGYAVVKRTPRKKKATVKKAAPAKKKAAPKKKSATKKRK